ncbi:hypothetical protein [Infirmifilum sp. SLHALR2]
MLACWGQASCSPGGCCGRAAGCKAASFKGKAGPASSHTDGITLTPTLTSDMGVIIREGEYVHPELVDLAKKLRPR